MVFRISSGFTSKCFVLPTALIVLALVVAGCDQNLSSSESKLESSCTYHNGEKMIEWALRWD